ncbi:MAG: hypothetical protein LBS21_04140 [Clostridiales bacterium]|jgi:hypothetical protein|nr:hypothetical protein [Clostridiales bacterium]
MKVIPFSRELNFKPYSGIVKEAGSLAASAQSEQSVNSEQLPELDTAEISDAAKYKFENVQKLDLKLDSQIKLSPPTARRIQMEIELMQEMKRAGFTSIEEKADDISNFEKLALSYDSVRKRLNENSEQSNKHGKFLDDAFEAVLTSMQASDGFKLSKSINGYTSNAVKLYELDPYVESAKNHAKIFSDTFLKEYKKNGIDALDTALAKLNDMPEGNSVFDMSYKDFKHLFENRQVQYLTNLQN